MRSGQRIWGHDEQTSTHPRNETTPRRLSKRSRTPIRIRPQTGSSSRSGIRFRKFRSAPCTGISGCSRKKGLVREIYGNDRRAHYDADISPHAHFMCDSCDQIIDVRGVQAIDWRTLKDLVGCNVAEQNVVFSGLCAHCRQQEPKQA